MMPLSARSMEWKNEGFDVQGWLLLPTNARTGKLPLVTVALHGGPAAAAMPHFYGPGVPTHALLEAGYALFLPQPARQLRAGRSLLRPPMCATSVMAICVTFFQALMPWNGWRP